MAFKVKLFYDAPDFEALQVAKLDSFALEPASYRPYSQAHVCFSPAGLHVQLLSFEAISPPDSLIEAVLKLPVGTFCLRLFADGRYDAVVSDKKEQALNDVLLHPISGEDLQGVFWGGLFTLPAAHYAGFVPAPDTSFTGNFYKLCATQEQAHQCSFYPADFTKPLDAPENLGEFTIINY